MILGTLAGAGVAGGLVLLFVGLRPAPPSVALTLAAYDAARTSGLRPVMTGSRWTTRWQRAVGVPLASSLLARGWLSSTARADLAVLGRDAPALVATKVGTAIAGVVTPALLAVAASTAGAHLPVLIPAWASLGGALIGYLIPDLRLRSAAAEARRDFRVAIGAYLDLVAMRMASGAGLSEALVEAARLGTGPAFIRLRGALADARTDGLAPTAALGRLGTELGLPDLVDVAARLSLVDTSGAQAEASLRAQAASLRDRELTDLQGASAERSQSMLVAQVVLGFGFLLFLGYPAVAKVLAI